MIDSYKVTTTNSNLQYYNRKYSKSRFIIPPTIDKLVYYIKKCFLLALYLI